MYRSFLSTIHVRLSNLPTSLSPQRPPANPCFTVNGSNPVAMSMPLAQTGHTAANLTSPRSNVAASSLPIPSSRPRLKPVIFSFLLTRACSIGNVFTTYPVSFITDGHNARHPPTSQSIRAWALRSKISPPPLTSITLLADKDSVKKFHCFSDLIDRNRKRGTHVSIANLLPTPT